MAIRNAGESAIIKVITLNKLTAKLKELEVALNGLPFVIKLNGKNIYPGWFWTKHSSFGCDRVWTWENPNENELNLAFGLGAFKCGTDPRKDEKLIQNAINN